MTQKRPTPSANFLGEHLTDQVVQYLRALPTLTLREKVLQLIELQETFRKLGKAVVIESDFSQTSARARIRKYFQDHRGQVLEGDELAIVSGISEYARRVRELRDEGMTILTGPEIDPKTGYPLRPDQYLLPSSDRSAGSARPNKKSSHNGSP